MRLPSASLLAVFTIGCLPSYKLTASSASTVAKPPTCEFRVVNLPPGQEFEEIATLTSEDGFDTDPAKFKERVRADVCRVGGDVVFTEINAKGWYVRGTVLRRVAGAPASVEAHPAPSAPPGS
jgi:hypothetical protein